MLVRRLSAFVLAMFLTLVLTSAVLAQASDQGDAGSTCAGCGVCGGGILVILAAVILPLVIVLAIDIAVAVWINKDAKARGLENATMWTVLGFFLGLLGLLIYILARPQGPTSRSPEV
jgi:hypothetical protein